MTQILVTENVDSAAAGAGLGTRRHRSSLTGRDALQLASGSLGLGPALVVVGVAA
jgi:hypothetical protein